MKTAEVLRAFGECYRLFDTEQPADGPNSHVLLSNAILGVGFMTGAELPGAAAALAVLVETVYPDDQWPWSSWGLTEERD